jgi:hypothetical protein
MIAAEAMRAGTGSEQIGLIRVFVLDGKLRFNNNMDRTHRIHRGAENACGLRTIECLALLIAIDDRSDPKP